MKTKLDPAAIIKAYKKQVKELQRQVIILQAERDAAAELCQRQHEKIERLKKKVKYDELPY